MDEQSSEINVKQLVALIDQCVDTNLTEFWNELRKLDETNQAQIEALIEEVGLIEQKLEEILADPDKGLEIRAEIIEKPKVRRKSRKKKNPAEEVT